MQRQIRSYLLSVIMALFFVTSNSFANCSFLVSHHSAVVFFSVSRSIQTMNERVDRAIGSAVTRDMLLNDLRAHIQLIRRELSQMSTDELRDAFSIWAESKFEDPGYLPGLTPNEPGSMDIDELSDYELSNVFANVSQGFVLLNMLTGKDGNRQIDTRFSKTMKTGVHQSPEVLLLFELYSRGLKRGEGVRAVSFVREALLGLGLEAGLPFGVH